MNTGTIVDRFELDVLGEAKDWIKVEPAEVNVFPDQSVAVNLVFSPPASPDLPAGEVRFGLRVMSHEDIEGSVVEEATVTVGSFTDYGITLLPTTKRSRFSGRFNVVIDNRGNAPAPVQLYASDPDARLTFDFRHEDVEVAYGKGVVVPLKVKPKKRKWRGADAPLPFQVLAVDADDDEREQTADGALVQAALVTDAMVKFALSVVAAVLALLALWFFVLQPSVESEARKQVAVATGQDPSALGSDSGGAAGGGTKGSAGGGNKKNGTAGGTGGANGAGGSGGSDNSLFPALGDAQSSSGGGAGGSDSGGGAGGPDPALQAFDFRVQTDVKPSSTFHTTSYTVPAGHTFYVSDIVFENTAGDTGILRLQRGDSVLMQMSLDTFRDRDNHFAEPVEFAAGAKVVLSVRCQTPGGQTSATGSSCTPAAYFSGRSVTTKS
ncbi:COG1470 family protein [Streptomyces griseofuscus]|uniref:COG1470 family protein n=1 Tax=Streptomyces griseofuscus TaxID=146922 RepID=UPI00345311B8